MKEVAEKKDSSMENWTVAEDRPGYRRKTIKRGNATINIYRPILSKEEASKALEQALDEMECALRSYHNRTAHQSA